MNLYSKIRSKFGSINLHAVGATTMVDCLMMVVQMVIGITVARALGPTGRGEYATILLWPMFVSGLIVGGVRFSMIYHVSGSIGKLADVVGTSIVALFTGSMIASLIIVGGSEFLLPAVSEECRRLLLVTSILLPLCSIGAALEPLLLGLKDYKNWNRLRLLDPICMFGCVVVLALLGRLTVASIVYAYLAIRIANTCLLFAYVRFRISSASVSVFSWDVIAYAAKSLPSGWLGNVNAQADQMVLSSLFSSASLGLYRTSANMSGFMRFAFIGFQRLVMTESANEQAESARLDQIASYLMACTTVSLTLMVPFMILIGPAIRLLYGEAFVDSIGPARVLVLAAVLRGGCGILGNGFRGLGKPLMPLWADILGAVALLAGFMLLIPKMGIMGAAIAVVISSASVFCSLLFAFLRCRRNQKASDEFVPLKLNPSMP